MTENVQTALISGLTVAVPAMFLAWLGYLKARKTDIKVEKQGVVIDTVHTLVNSQMGAQKRMLAEVTASKAAITKSKTDKAAADVAFKDWQEHEAKQAKVDAKLVAPAPLV